MKIELRKIRVIASMSQDGLAFEALIYIDGKKVGSVCNAGYGGPDCFSPDSVKQRIEEYARTLPPVPPSFFGPDYSEGLPMTAELLIAELLDEYQESKSLKAKMTKRLIFRMSNGKIMMSNRLGARQLSAIKEGGERFIRKVFKLNEGDVILNDLPISEALKLYRASAE